MTQQEKPQEAINQNDVSDQTISSASKSEGSNTANMPTLRKKSIAFHLTFVAILVNLFLYALDATTLAVATPVSPPECVTTFKFTCMMC